jgi:hypothetical protein
MRRVPFPFKQKIPDSGWSGNAPPVFGDSQIRITVDIDTNGLMRTSLNKPLPAVQVIGLLLDCMQGQYQEMARQASLLINPKGESVANEQEKENHNDRGGDSTGRASD